MKFLLFSIFVQLALSSCTSYDDYHYARECIRKDFEQISNENDENPTK